MKPYLLLNETLKLFSQGLLGSMTFGIYHQYNINTIMKLNNANQALQQKYLIDKIENQKQEIQQLQEQIQELEQKQQSKKWNFNYGMSLINHIKSIYDLFI